MSLAEAVVASLVLMLGCSSAAQLWCQGLRANWDLAQREGQLVRLDSLMAESEGRARTLANSQGPAANCLVAANQLVPMLQTMPAAVAPGQPANLSLPPVAPGLLHIRWEVGGFQRERLLSLSALGLCQEGGYGQ